MQIRLIRKPGALTILLSGPLREEHPQCLSLGWARERGVPAEPFREYRSLGFRLLRAFPVQGL